MYEIETIIPLALVIGVLMGAGITWALLKNSASQVTERVSHEYESDLAVLEEKLFSRENELSRLNADHARLEAELDEQVSGPRAARLGPETTHLSMPSRARTPRRSMHVAAPPRMA